MIHGLAIIRGSETLVHHVKDAKVAVFGCDLQAESGDTKGTVVFKSAEELINYTRSEELMMENIVKKLSEAGVNVVFVGGSISEIAIHYLQKYSIMTLKILSKFEIK